MDTPHSRSYIIYSPPLELTRNEHKILTKRNGGGEENINEKKRGRGRKETGEGKEGTKQQQTKSYAKKLTHPPSLMKYRPRLFSIA